MGPRFTHHLLVVYPYSFFVDVFVCSAVLSVLFLSFAERERAGCFTCTRTPDKSAYWKIIFLISQTKHVVGTQKNCLIETSQ